MPGQGVMVHGLIPNAPPYEVLTTAGVCVAGMAAMKHAYNAVRTGEHQSSIAWHLKLHLPSCVVNIFKPKLNKDC